jgi:hypothetical protein
MEFLEPIVTFFWIATLFYGLAAAVQVVAFIQKKEKLANLAMKLVWIGIFAHTLNFIWPAIKQNYTGI